MNGLKKTHHALPFSRLTSLGTCKRHDPGLIPTCPLKIECDERHFLTPTLYATRCGRIPWSISSNLLRFSHHSLYPSYPIPFALPPISDSSGDLRSPWPSFILYFRTPFPLVFSRNSWASRSLRKVVRVPAAWIIQVHMVSANLTEIPLGGWVSERVQSKHERKEV